MSRLLALAVLVAACSGPPDITMAPPPAPLEAYRAEIPDPLPTGRLPAWATPRHYALDLAIDPHADEFQGTARITIALGRPSGAIVLHGADLNVDHAHFEVGSEGGVTNVAAETTYRAAAGASSDREELVVTASNELPEGEVVLVIGYRARLTQSLRGIYKVVIASGDDADHFVFTQLEPSDARRMFPSFDDPIYKVPFDISVTAPAVDEVYANAPETQRETLADGRVKHVFATTQPLPTYLVALAVGPLETLSGGDEPVPLRLVAGRGKAAQGELALALTKSHLAIAKDYFGSPYPYAKLDLVAVPNFGAGAMENAGLITFREELLLADEKVSAQRKRDIALTVAHELAHQWFGNLVTMKWWDDLWLNEGFATFMEALIVDRHDPSMQADLERLSLTGRVMSLDALRSARRVRQPVANTYEAEDAFDGITYLKGAAVVEMLHAWLGEDDFKTGLQSYLTRHRGGNAEARDLFRALSEASGKDVAAVASTFVDQPGVPLVRAALDCSSKPQVTLSQLRYRALEGQDTSARWRIPVCVEHDGGRACTIMADSQATLPLERCPPWLLPNAGHRGYYRYSLPPKDLDALAKVVRRGTLRDRVGFLTNYWALVQAGEVPAARLIDELLAYKGTSERQVVDEIITHLGHLADAVVTDETRGQFERLVEALLLPQAKQLGWDARADEREDDRLLRESLLTALSIHSDGDWMLRQARPRARAFMDGEHSDGGPIALWVAARHGEIGFDALMTAYREAQGPRRIPFVRAMGALAGPAFDEVLAAIAAGEIRGQDVIYIADVASKWSDSRARLTDWMRDNLAPLAERIPGFGVARMMGVLGRICEPARRDAARATFEPIVARLGGTGRRLDMALDAADLCIDLRRRQTDAVTSYLLARRRF